MLSSVESPIVRRLGSVAVAVLLLVFIGFIGPATWGHVRRTQDLLSLKRQLASPPKHDISESGLLDEHLYDMISSFNGGSAAAKARHVLLVFDATQCAPCAGASNDWIAVAEGTYALGPVEVWVVVPDKTSPSSLPSSLTAKGIPFRLLTPADPRTFAVRTGVRGMPMGIAFRDRSGIDCVFTGKPKLEALEACRANLSRPLLTSLTFFGAEMVPFIAPSRMIAD